jgi:hypothetical protein
MIGRDRRMLGYEHGELGEFGFMVHGWTLLDGKGLEAASALS